VTTGANEATTAKLSASTALREEKRGIFKSASWLVLSQVFYSLCVAVMETRKELDVHSLGALPPHDVTIYVC
jgi:hypothetical protein